jgi:hypothetical protein
MPGVEYAQPNGAITRREVNLEAKSLVVQRLDGLEEFL